MDTHADLARAAQAAVEAFERQAAKARAIGTHAENGTETPVEAMAEWEALYDEAANAEAEFRRLLRGT